MQATAVVGCQLVVTFDCAVCPTLLFRRPLSMPMNVAGIALRCLAHRAKEAWLVDALQANLTKMASQASRR